MLPIFERSRYSKFNKKKDVPAATTSTTAALPTSQLVHLHKDQPEVTNEEYDDYY